ncbi:MAG: UbiH/UbiF family hydroxylase [Alphaproteobacteria bacterium]|nr:UbiH/UbiF family hydroxylase [Alphaproteobacteria bacterium]
MEKIDVDILISGAGIAGLSAACAFGSAGFSVLCVDPNPPVTSESDANSDLRTTAFLQPSKRLFESAGLWNRLEPHAAALQIMRIVDAGGASYEARDIADFDASDISDAPFGWNLPNWLLRREMLGRIDELDNVSFRAGTATTRLTTRQTEARVTLSDGQLVVAKLLLAADGRASNIRAQSNISVKTWRYGQKALAFSVTHTIPHNNVSTEIHRTGGPFTFVPMPDLDGKPRSAIVWMEKGARIRELLSLSVKQFEAEIFERSAHLFGPMNLIGRRTAWPIVSQLANSLVGQRTALIAEAAHVVPPIGAQGLNMSLADLSCLLDLAIADPQQVGSDAMLSKYQRARWPETRARVMGIDLLNRSSMAENPMLRDLRRAGLKTLHDIKPLRKTLMKAGLGAT